MEIIGVNIKKLRTEGKISLRELAKKLNVSASFLSQVETGKATPSISTLKALADSLQTSVGALLGESDVENNNPVLKGAMNKAGKRTAEGMTVSLLTSPDPTKQMEPLLFELEKNATSGRSQYKHFGQEFVLVLKGALEITLNETRYMLQRGDSIYFNSSTPHIFKNVFNGETQALWVVTPPTF
ncbi:MAG: hypothetical protein A2268_12395 [Candidatus Raymondbacteria bacterium RifOxyA12_full_50_37]|uniref:HTH cro/C1-type domain-containing protein n=1 Tax=Candidatus Raymondbacteria bacterium RIFOXYD12_FULL_49_13 TaxID=1817890 RepID=A0A1F7F8R0_UNCRA|nr:MAG: hypothetical protein A2268_12395 [Candidatus Raymondbacteria bacterium RifOxyA12_full_50_37]OGJ91338.1 MAG: hypothetical protein A2248_03890 [Candidatus Raymondbacteria bacterium RIFOXYA2_FULL_49_16]OGJ91568.1 MAG: hypothetical protein A2350_11810 [Candidatus Raymondbacteria bacterium RifOxyB12_full_50_8]OGJ97757.1 MAG: hypothetical protein A2453_13830 [Candidatus Raymondbacteria bacterium RIFOXYC2_FULL_50_21]OGK00141.1 MAG: hypothetical protein A2487_09500 [Candidatus Raymondbacteria b